MIEPIYDSVSVTVMPEKITDAYSHTATDTIALLEGFSFFCGDERARDIWVHISIGQAKIKPFCLLKGYRKDSMARLYLKAQDTLRVRLENKSTFALQVDCMFTLRKYL